MFKSIRCGSNSPTPYLKKYLDRLDIDKSCCICADLGCGNGRNSKYLVKKGFLLTFGFDKAEDAPNKVDLGKQKVPLDDNSCGLILCNYLLCFLNNNEREHLIGEIDRIAKTDCVLFVEMFEAKSAKAYVLDNIKNQFKNWEAIHQIKDRFILKKMSK